jgi:hypothetical protein
MEVVGMARITADAFRFGDEVFYKGDIYRFLMYQGIKFAMLCQIKGVNGKNIACNYQDVYTSDLTPVHNCQLQN